MIKLKFPFLFICFLLSAGFSSFAQQNTVLDELFHEEKATTEKCTYLVLTAAGIIADDVPTAEALSRITPKEWHVTLNGPDTPIKLGQLATLIMEAFEFRGGLFYSLFPGPRYATREISFRRFAEGRISPYMTISGSEAMMIVRNAVVWKEKYP